MKKALYFVLCGALAMTLFAACGGGSSSSAGGSTNKIAGLASEVEAIIADYQASYSEFKQKVEKFANTEKNPDLTKITKFTKERERLDKDTKAKLDAVAKKMAGKEIPYELSEGLFYSVVSPLTIDSASSIGYEAVRAEVSFRIKINNPLTVARFGGYEFPVCYKWVDAKGSTIGKSMVLPFNKTLEAVEVPAGEEIKLNFGYQLPRESRARKLVFISKAEYDALK